MHIRTALVALVLLFAGIAFAQKPDLTGSELILSGSCSFQGGSLPYLVFRKEGKHFLIFHGNDGHVISIRQVHDGARSPCQLDDSTTIWTEDEETTIQV